MKAISQTNNFDKVRVTVSKSKVAMSPKKSVGQLIMENIPDGKYKGLSTILEPHESPKRK
jgi:predicted transcriptional regulator